MTTVSTNARRRSGARRPTSVSNPSANAVSVDIAMPRPSAAELPTLNVDGHSGAHTADRREQREHEPPALAKVAEVELAPRLQTQHEEEQRHQPAVHPLGQCQLNPSATEVDREHGPTVPRRTRRPGSPTR